MELGNRPAYAWQSILAAQRIVKHGSRWQVGDGSSINIKTDKWLHRPSTFSIPIPPIGLPLEATDSSLICPQSGTWDAYMIRQQFVPDNASAILSIPLSSHLPRDLLVWAYSFKGTFSVRSAYRVAITLPPNTELGGSSNDQNRRSSGQFYGVSMCQIKSSFFLGGHLKIFFQQRWLYVIEEL